MAVVYSITHRESGREYIGVTSKKPRVRWRQHVAHARAGRSLTMPVVRALAKHGAEAFEFKVEAELPTFEEAKLAEMIAIATRRPAFNATAGGDGIRGLKHRQDTRAKMSAIAKARGQRPPAMVGTEAARKATLGVKFTPERSAAQSLALRKRYGCTWTTPEERRAVSASKSKAYYWANRQRILDKLAAQRTSEREARPAKPRAPRARMSAEEKRARVSFFAARWREANPAKVAEQQARRKQRRRDAAAAKRRGV